MFTHQKYEILPLLSRAISWNQIGCIFGMIVLGILGLFFLVFGVSIMIAPLIILGLLPLGGIWLLIYKFKGDLKGEKYWLNLFVANPQKIVWIKPINIKHTAAFVVTLYNEMHFQIHDSDGLSVTIKCDQADKQQIFYRGIKSLVPHAHVGYTAAIEQLYKSNPQQFLQTIQAHGSYFPAGNLGVA